jgi:hypothetical protein
MPPRGKPSPRVVPGRALPKGAGAPGAEQVRMDIRPAPPTPAQRVAWDALWRLLLGRPPRPLDPLGNDDQEISQT